MSNHSEAEEPDPLALDESTRLGWLLGASQHMTGSEQAKLVADWLVARSQGRWPSGEKIGMFGRIVLRTVADLIRHETLRPAAGDTGAEGPRERS